MKKSFLLTLSILLFTFNSHAYDEDTHFYGTYTMARFAGLRHEVAVKVALSAQWMDESYISDPTSMIFLPITGIKKRRLLHFPSSRIVGKLNAEAQQSVTGLTNLSGPLKIFIDKFVENAGFDGDIATINLVTETEENHPFASELFMEGLKEGNLMKCGASIHVLEDSFAHAGTPAEQGHAAFWHWPDRAYASVDKYFRMTKTVFRALVAIRAQLPNEAIDCDVRVANVKTPNCEMDAKRLADVYEKLPAIKKTVGYNVLQDKEYVENALQVFLRRAVHAKYMYATDAQIDQWVKELKIDGKINAYDALEKLIKKLVDLHNHNGQEILDIPFIMKDLGKLNGTSIKITDYIASYGDDEAINMFIHQMSRDLLAWHVPSPLSDSHRMELEDDNSPIRLKEMEIRIRNMRNLISQLYGIDVELIGNNTKDDKGFSLEINEDPAAEPKIPQNSKTVYATFSMKEKNEWDNMIFHYLFPDLKKDDLKTAIVAFKSLDQLINLSATFSQPLSEYLKNRDAINNSDAMWTTKKARLLALDYAFGRDNLAQLKQMNDNIDAIVNRLGPMKDAFLHDTFATHLVPSGDNLFYQSAKLFEQYKKTNVIKPLLGQTDVWNLPDLSAEVGQYPGMAYDRHGALFSLKASPAKIQLR